MSTWTRVLIDTRPLRGGAYRRLWVSTLVTSVGSMLTAVAVPLQIYQVTGSSAYVGLLGAVTLVPLVVFGLWGGTVADAVDRRKLLLVTDSGLVVTSVLLWAQAAAGLRSVWLLLALAGVQQAFAGAGGSAHGAAVARLVTAELLPAANALHATVRQLGAIVGPLLAGAALPFVGVATLYLADAVALGVTVWAVWGLPSIPPLDGSPRRPGGRSLVAGLGYLVGQKLLLMVLVSDLVAMVFGMPTALFPELAQETFGDPRGGGPALGLLFAAWPIGYTLAGALSGAVTRLRRHGAMVTVAVCAWGLAVVGLGLSRTLLLAVLCFALGGAACFVLGIFRRTILQSADGDEVRGRIQGVDTVVSAGGPLLAVALHGAAGAALGTTWAISGGGLLVIALMLAAAAAYPAFWHYRAPGTDG